MRTVQCKLNCKHGLHARPAAFVAGLCSGRPGGWSPFPQTEFRILRSPNKDPLEVDPKSIIELMSAVFEHGEEVTLEVKGNCELMASEFFKVVWENLADYADDVEA